MLFNVYISLDKKKYNVNGLEKLEFDELLSFRKTIMSIFEIEIVEAVCKLHEMEKALQQQCPECKGEYQCTFLIIKNEVSKVEHTFTLTEEYEFSINLIKGSIKQDYKNQINKLIAYVLLIEIDNKLNEIECKREIMN